MWRPADDRYDRMSYRQCGNSGLSISALSLGLWHNFGPDIPFDVKQAVCRQAVDLGITHYDLNAGAGSSPGSAEETFGEILRSDFRDIRDELVISVKAGFGASSGNHPARSSRKHLVASCDRSLRRMGLDYVDIFYTHHRDPKTPLEETMSALDHIVRSGRALYVGLSAYDTKSTREAVETLKDLGTPCLVYQPRHVSGDHWMDDRDLMTILDENGVGAIVFSPLAQGLLTSRRLSRALQDESMAAMPPTASSFQDSLLNNVRRLNGIAAGKGQSLAQMVLAWILWGGKMTSTLIGATRPEQVVDCVMAMNRVDFSIEELTQIDWFSREVNVRLSAVAAQRRN